MHLNCSEKQPFERQTLESAMGRKLTLGLCPAVCVILHGTTHQVRFHRQYKQSLRGCDVARFQGQLPEPSCAGA
jgi:hypothetical protein